MSNVKYLNLDLSEDDGWLRGEFHTFKTKYDIGLGFREYESVIDRNNIVYNKFGGWFLDYVLHIAQGNMPYPPPKGSISSYKSLREKVNNNPKIKNLIFDCISRSKRLYNLKIEFLEPVSDNYDFYQNPFKCSNGYSYGRALVVNKNPSSTNFVIEANNIHIEDGKDYVIILGDNVNKHPGEIICEGSASSLLSVFAFKFTF